MYRPGLLAQEDTKAGRLRRIPAAAARGPAESSTKNARGRRSFVPDRPATAVRPLTQPSPARTRAGPASKRSGAARKPGAEPTTVLYPGARPDTSRL
jgi:hypothetical protein